MKTELRILFLEDVPEDAELIERTLRKAKLQFTARTADNKRDLLKKLKEFQPDLILSDYSMPQFTGLEALEMVKEVAPSTPFIIVTGSISEETAVECMKAGAVDYVLKDRLKRIGPAVEAALENKRIREENARVEKALVASAREWKTTFDAINDAVCLLDMNGNVLRCNTAMKNLVGKPFGEIIGKGCWGLFRDVISPDILCPFVRMHESLHRETTLVELNNRWLDILVDPILDEAGALIGGVQIITNVTERKQAEEALRNREGLLQKIFDILPVGLWFADKDGKLLRGNTAGVKIWGAEPKVSQSEYGVFKARRLPSGEDVAPDDWALAHTIRDKVTIVDELLEIDAFDGKKKTILNYTAPVLDAQGDVQGAIVVNLDITGRKQAEEEREKLLLWQQGVNQLQQSLLEQAPFENKLKIITDSIVSIFDADFCRIWLIRPGDLCEQDCIHARVQEGPHVCRDRDKCLHLLVSSGRYTHTDGEGHRRVPFGCYKIGRVASDEDHKFITNDVQNDPRVHNHEWARELGLESFAGYQLHVPGGQTLGVLALFARHPILPAEDAMLDGLGSSIAMVIQQAFVEKERRESKEKYLQLFDEAPIGYQELDIEGKIVRVNKTEADMMGYTIDEMVGKTIFDFISLDEQEEAKYRYNERIYNQLPSQGFERRYITKSGKYLYLSVTDKLVFDEKGQVTGARATLQDITERKKAEEEIKNLAKFPTENPNPVLRVTKDGTILFANKSAAANILKISDLKHDQRLPDKLMNIVTDVFSSGLRKDSEIECGDRIFAFTFLAIADSGYVNIYALDITDRKHAENALIESEARYKILFETAAEGIMIADIQTKKQIYANPAICKMLGYRLEELIGMGVKDIHPREEVEHVISEFEAQAQGKKTLVQLPCLRKDGKIIYVEINAVMAMIDGRECNVGFFTDITKRKRAEEERIRLVTAIEQVSECIVITDVNGTIQYVNPAFEKITGYSGEEAISQNPRILKSGKQNEAFYKTLWDTILSGNTWNGHFINKKKDDTIYEEEASISPIKDNAGNITNFVAVKRDVTNELMMEQRQRESQKMEAIGTLAGGIAHDFNNILAGIIGYTELSLDAVPEESQLHSDLTKIFKAGYRARDLVNQILTFSRQREQEKRPIMIAPIIKESLKLLRASLPSTVEIRQNIESEPGTVLADPTQIHQVIMNLCTNAGHAMREKGGILEVSLCSKELDSEFCLRHPGLVPGHYLILMVSDTGHGIPPEILPRIFEPYFTTKDKSGGTGLGLSVVHGIVSGSGGTVTVYSEPGKGTTFKVYLPVIMEEPVPEVEKTKPVSRGHERILLIDDEKDIVDVGKRILEQLGYTVTIMTSSMESLELFQKDPHQFDLVISDMTMPFMTGDELAEEFMRIRQDIPIIISTGYSEKLTEERALSIGIRAYLGKPLLKSEIAETVRRILDQQSEEA